MVRRYNVWRVPGTKPWVRLERRASCDPFAGDGQLLRTAAPVRTGMAAEGALHTNRRISANQLIRESSTVYYSSPSQSFKAAPGNRKFRPGRQPAATPSRAVTVLSKNFPKIFRIRPPERPFPGKNAVFGGVSATEKRKLIFIFQCVMFHFLNSGQSDAVNVPQGC